MLVTELVDHVRTEVLRDIQSPQLFSNEALVAYLNEGLAHMARKTHVFTDQFELTTVGGQRRYDLETTTIFVISATYPNGRALAPFTRRVKPYIWTGRPTAYSMDSAQRRMTLHPTPDDEYELLITRAIKPDALMEASEIPLPDDQAMLLGEWMTYRALRNNDPDGSDTVAADQFYESWLEGLRDMKREGVRFLVGDNPSAHPRRWT